MTCDICFLVSIALKEDTMNELGYPNVYSVNLRRFKSAVAIATENYLVTAGVLLCYTVCNHFVPK